MKYKLSGCLGLGAQAQLPVCLGWQAAILEYQDICNRADKTKKIDHDFFFFLLKIENADGRYIL